MDKTYIKLRYMGRYMLFFKKNKKIPFLLFTTILFIPSLWAIPSGDTLDTKWQKASLNRARINAQDSQGETALSRAIRAKKLDTVKRLVKQGAKIDTQNNEGRTPFALAVFLGELGIADFLLEYKADINTRDNEDVTPFAQAILSERLDIAEFLFERGADINTQDSDGQTPLAIAVCQQNLASVKFLCRRGAGINTQDNGGKTPLIDAMKLKEVDIAEYLIVQGADIHAQDNKDHTAFTYAYKMFKYRYLSEQKLYPLHNIMQHLLTSGAKHRVTFNRHTLNPQYEYALNVLLCSEQPLMEHFNSSEFKKRFEYLDDKLFRRLNEEIQTQEIILKHNQIQNAQQPLETKRMNQGLAYLGAAELFKEFTDDFFPDAELAQKAQTGFTPSDFPENPSALEPTWKKMFTNMGINSETGSEHRNILDAKTISDTLVEYIPSKTVFLHLRKQFYQMVKNYVVYEDKEALTAILKDLQETIELWEHNEVISLRQAKLCRDTFTADKIQNLLKQ